MAGSSSSGCFSGPGLPKVTPVSTTLVKPEQAANSSEMIKLRTLDPVSSPLLVVRMPFVFSQFLDPKLMASSLASTLTAFPLFAGRLRIDADKDYAVELNGAGASLAIAKCDATLEDILPEGILEAKTSPIDGAAAKAATASTIPTSAFSPRDFSQFMPKCPRTIFGYRNGTSPLLHAQVTGLQGGSTILTIVALHLMADQDTCRTLLKAWSQNYTKALIEKKKMDLGVQPSSAKVISGTAVNDTAGAPGAKPLMVGEILESYAAPRLPAGWISPRFERRSWRYAPKMINTTLLHILTKGPPVTLAYHVPAARLAELKSEASKALAAGGPGAPEWISTKDALAARIRQVMSELPGTSGKKELQLVVDLRKRLNPQIPDAALGNCSWSVGLPPISSAQNGRSSASTAAAPSAVERSEELGAMAGQIRVALNNIIENLDISNELKWLQENVREGSTMPVVFRNFFYMLHPGGPLLLSHWTWGEQSYEDLQFGGGEHSTPVWHQPCFDLVPNTAFVVPAGSAAPGGGVLVHITLHKKFAKMLKSLHPTL